MHFLILAAVLAPVLSHGPVQPLDRILVTAVASRASQPADETPATVSVIEREDLERSLSRDLRAALRYEPGVSVENGAARFGLGNIAIRGLEGNRVVMLQDGIRLPDNYRVGSFSNANRNPFDLGLLSRIEILRGPGSALYGSDALAGVVSMTTLDPRDLLRRGARSGGFAEMSRTGADDSWTGTGGVAAAAGLFEGVVAASRTQGHERENRGEDAGTGAARTAPNPQDGWSQAVLAKITTALPRGGRLRFTFDGFERRVQTDVLSLNPQSIKSVSLLADDRAERGRASVDARFFALGPVDQFDALAYRQRSRTAQDTVEERADTTAACLSANGAIRCRREARFRFEQDEVGLTLIGQTAIGSAHRLVYGVEAARIEVDESRDGNQVNLATGAVTNVVGTDIFPTRDFPLSRMRRFGVFAQDEIALGSATVIPALRYDRFTMRPQPDALYLASNPGRRVVSLDDHAVSPRLGVLVALGATHTFTGQVATGFRAPPYHDANVGLSTLPLGFAVIANPDLEPETSRGLELGVRGRHPGLDYAFTVFHTRYQDLIVSRAPLPCPGDARCVPGAPITFQSQNVSRARIEGAEARVQWRFMPGWIARGGAAWSRGEDLSKGVPLNSIDPAKVVAGLAWEPPGGAWGGALDATWVAEKARIDQSAGPITAAPTYTVLDATAFVRIGRNVTVHAGVFNVSDRKYWLWSDIRGLVNRPPGFDRHTQPGRNASLQVKYTF